MVPIDLLQISLGDENLYFPKGNNLVYCSNYDRRDYKLWYKVPSSSEEDIWEDSCAPTDPEAVVTSLLLPKGKY